MKKLFLFYFAIACAAVAQVVTPWADIGDKPTTLAGYGVTPATEAQAIAGTDTAAPMTAAGVAAAIRRAPSGFKVIWVGTSISTGGASSFPTLASAMSFYAHATSVNTAVGGRTLGSIIAAYAEEVAPHLANGAGPNCLVNIEIGANDYDHTLAADWTTGLRSYIQTIRNTGAHVSAKTVMRRIGVGFGLIGEQNRLAYNHSLAILEQEGLIDWGVVDIASMIDPSISGGDFSVADDWVHPNAVGKKLIAIMDNAHMESRGRTIMRDTVVSQLSTSNRFTVLNPGLFAPVQIIDPFTQSHEWYGFAGSGITYFGSRLYSTGAEFKLQFSPNVEFATGPNPTSSFDGTWIDVFATSYFSNTVRRLNIKMPTYFSAGVDFSGQTLVFSDNQIDWSKIAKTGNLRSGAGTPEGAVTAPVGTLYTRTDGGAGTTLYVKESGSGNTGWAAK
ncbi:MAG: SGNH/GDSL hydrolase family protein [Verrucomicrobia bacterium]|nr:SGNH/GDSL hydrolase family protein [Verrucomicrobiota bacterium]